jgi:hypothetical protein
MQRYAQAALARTLLDGGKREPALELPAKRRHRRRCPS